MKERIRQLALQAEKIVKSKYPNDDMNVGVARMMDVFGELIVKECQRRVEEYIGDCGEINSLPDIVIMEHFGVEK